MPFALLLKVGWPGFAEGLGIGKFPAQRRQFIGAWTFQ